VFSRVKPDILYETGEIRRNQLKKMVDMTPTGSLRFVCWEEDFFAYVSRGGVVLHFKDFALGC
jgi:hypothetical protein